MKKTFVEGLIFLLLPLCLLEVSIRTGLLAPAPDPWFREIAASACRGPLDFVFAGSSRVAAAIDMQAFTSRIAAAVGRPVTAVNMGRGYTTMAEHDLALRRLYETCPAQMARATVFIEGPQGLPDYSTFGDPWVHPDEPGLILPLIHSSDVDDLWRSHTPLVDKLQVTLRLLRSVDYIDATRWRVLYAGERVRQLVAAHWGGQAKAAATATDLTSDGGVMNDAPAVARARRLAVSLASSTFKDDPRVEDWTATVLSDVNRLVHEQGGTLVVFYMPLSSVQQSAYQTAARRDDAESFRRAANESDIRFLTPWFPTTDVDFPDLWHLRRSRAGEFSAAIAGEYLAVTSRVARRAAF